MPRIVPIFLMLMSAAMAQKPIGEVESTDATVRGAVILASGGATVMSGSQITAGANAARLKLTRGGELLVCSQSSISITSSATGKEHLIGLNSGAIEIHYSLSSAADTIMTPDFRVQLPGPGQFHVAVSMNSKGDTCVQSLAGNTSSVVVNEQMGDGTHQVRPGEHVVFHNSSVAIPETASSANCGCPTPPPVQKAKEELGFPEEESKRAAEEIKAGKYKAEAAGSFSSPVNTASGPAQLQVDAPMVFKGDAMPAVAAPSSPESSKAVEPVKLASATEQASTTVAEGKPEPKMEPPPVAKPHKKNIFQRIGSAFASLFKAKK